MFDRGWPALEHFGFSTVSGPRSKGKQTRACWPVSSYGDISTYRLHNMSMFDRLDNIDSIRMDWIASG